MNTKYIVPLFASICMLFTACAETDDLQNADDTVNVTMSLSTRAAIGQPKDPVTAKELINDYYIIFCDRNGKVVDTYYKDCAPTELDQFSMEMAPGTYYVYAFANIPQDYVNTTLQFAKGATIPHFPNALQNTYYAIPDAFNDSKLIPVESFIGNIPMTSREAAEITVSEKATQSFGIEVRRLFAKMQFVFSNTTDNDIEVRGQSISNLTINGVDTINAVPKPVGAIRLMNYNDNSVLLSSKARHATLSHSFTTPMVLDKFNEETGSFGTDSVSYYVLESIADNVTNSFLLDFDVIRKNDTPTDSLDFMRYALTDRSTLPVIRRNDWIRIPITFSDWQMRLDAVSYPPIGGYPEAEVKESEGNAFTVIFQGGGEFSIRPFIRKYFDGSEWFGIDQATKINGTPTITVEDASALFVTPPTLTKSGEIIGKMRNEPGRVACVTISANVIESETPSLMTTTLTRKIYVTQK